MAGWGDQGWGTSWGGDVFDPDAIPPNRVDIESAVFPSTGVHHFGARQRIGIVRGDYGQDTIFKLFSGLASEYLAPYLDLAQYEVRAMYSKLLERSTSDYGGIQYSSPDNGIFYRKLTKFTQRLVPPVFFDDAQTELAVWQPEYPQRIIVQTTIVDTPGSIMILGLDIDGNIINENVDCLVPGLLHTVAEYASITSVTANGSFFADIFVSDGKCRLVWEQGDSDDMGMHELILELHKEGQVVSGVAPIHVFVSDRRAYPLPAVSAVTGELTASGAVLITGSNFLDTSGITVTEDATLTETIVPTFVEVSGTSLTAVLPSVLPVGAYKMRVIGPGGTGASIAITIV